MSSPSPPYASLCAHMCVPLCGFCHCSFLQFLLLYQDANWQRYLLPLNNPSIYITLFPHTPGLGVQWWWHWGTVAHQKGLLKAPWLSRWKHTNHLCLQTPWASLYVYFTQGEHLNYSSYPSPLKHVWVVVVVVVLFRECRIPCSAYVQTYHQTTQLLD